MGENRYPFTKLKLKLFNFALKEVTIEFGLGATDGAIHSFAKLCSGHL